MLASYQLSCIAILLCFRTLYYTLTASGGTTLFGLKVHGQMDGMPFRIYPALLNGQRRRQTCTNPPAFDLGQGFTTDGDGRAWMSSSDTEAIWSCTILDTELCDCVSEVAAVGTAVQSLAVDETRVYWTNGSGIFYIERNSDPIVVLTLSSSMMNTSILATSPGLQQLPGACCMSKSTLFSVDYACDHWGILGCVHGREWKEKSVALALPNYCSRPTPGGYVL